MFFDFSVHNIQDHRCFVNSLDVMVNLIDKSQLKQKRAFLERIKKTTNDIVDMVLGNAR